MTNYMTSVGRLPQSTALWIGTSCLGVFVVVLPLMGWLSDQLGRRPR
jgi:MFS transporter, MHS family, proline/betaine transporter